MSAADAAAAHVAADQAHAKHSPWLESAPAGVFTTAPRARQHTLIHGAAWFAAALVLVGPFAYRMHEGYDDDAPLAAATKAAPPDAATIQRTASPAVAVPALAARVDRGPSDASSEEARRAAAFDAAPPPPSVAAAKAAPAPRTAEPVRRQRTAPAQVAQAQIGRSGTYEVRGEDSVKPPPPVQGPCNAQVAALGLCTSVTN